MSAEQPESTKPTTASFRLFSKFGKLRMRTSSTGGGGGNEMASSFGGMMVAQNNHERRYVVIGTPKVVLKTVKKL